MRTRLRNKAAGNAVAAWHATWIVGFAMITRIDRRAYNIPAPHLSGALPKAASGSNPSLQTGSMAIPVHEDPSRSTRTVQTRSRGVGAMLRLVLGVVSLPVKTPHLAAIRFFMFGTFTGLSIACALILAIRPADDLPKRRTATSETSGARTLILLRPAIAFERAHAGVQMAKAPVTPPRITTTTSATPVAAKRVASTRPTATNLFAAALSP